ncbi:hypothetical protein G6F70_009091 [Rhizopus microsporus]|uniref:Necrosis inducing protein (NPP1) n=2 Tax=Rhizopus TaxID=4842 RepID=A0A367JV45_RHIAZ|nr:hypothetical protein G6F71_009059 [Rhizopus microsporus]RCH93813.1 hypothetical protein CU097_013142 [Rhizopus azygosporus]KAG1193272.1 hypothetical protein G6F70_009091 [Rhizopus microsporus]KAG1206246.1 hypothetical protein G6F69_008972 [Rhizopus microsporus]KAG1226229.1 hypothetical protein G6F67_009064 [Rhizopus microsporus]
MIRSIAALFLFANLCVANTPIPDSQSTDFTSFALGARPYWQLSRALNHDMCWPSACVENGAVVPSADLKNFPVAGQGGCPPAGSRFPVYWNAKKCTDTEIRVAYNLFWKKDGFSPSGIYGHGYDWEQVIVVYAKGGNSWSRKGAYLSGHGGYKYYDWNEMTTSNESNIAAGGQNMDHPKIFPAWAKHSMFIDSKDGNPVLEGLDAFDENAFRTSSYQYFNAKEEMIQVVPNTQLWTLIANKDWNKASSSPNVVYDKLCTIK